MKERLDRLRTRIDGLSLRERLLLFLAGTAALALLWRALLMDPLAARQERAYARMESVGKELTILEQQARAIVEKGGLDPDRENRRARDGLKAQLGSLDERIAAAVQGLIEPAQMTRALEEVLKRETGLRLIRVQSLGSRPLFPSDEAGSVPGIYQHSLRLEFRGSYLDTIAYLRALQALPWTFYWDELEIGMDKYPKAEVAITVHTLSLSEGWIGA